MREIVSAIVRAGMNRKQAVARIAAWSREKIAPDEQVRFIKMAEAEVVSLHEGDFARYQITPSEFASWQKLWETTERSSDPRASE
ncbi:hypothetical protein [Lichenicoccus sp.]|uniref:hypothetical protein n=1 Tax=Lichenicoccus sp. TaxID=2781899 RepID=UPI003D146301